MMEYITTMIENGFPKSDFDLLVVPEACGCRLRRSWNSIRLQKHAVIFCKKRKVDLTALVYSDVFELSSEYVGENVPPQFTDKDGPGWYDETFELWNDVFSSLIEVACLELYMTNGNAFMNKCYRNNNKQI